MAKEDTSLEYRLKKMRQENFDDQKNIKMFVSLYITSNTYIF